MSIFEVHFTPQPVQFFKHIDEAVAAKKRKRKPCRVWTKPTMEGRPFFLKSGNDVLCIDGRWRWESYYAEELHAAYMSAYQG